MARRPFIRDLWRAKMHEYLGGTVRGLGGVPESICGLADHVHLLVGLRATHCLADEEGDIGLGEGQPRA